MTTPTSSDVEASFARASGASLYILAEALRELLLLIVAGGGGTVDKAAVLLALGITDFIVTNTTITISFTGDDAVTRSIVLPLV